jgi:hypothetical protein
LFSRKSLLVNEDNKGADAAVKAPAANVFRASLLLGLFITGKHCGEVTGKKKNSSTACLFFVPE